MKKIVSKHEAGIRKQKKEILFSSQAERSPTPTTHDAREQRGIMRFYSCTPDPR